MIYRRIVRLKTTGSREKGNLRPGIELEKGFNLIALEYDENAGECICEIWCSDHPLIDGRKTKIDLDTFVKGMTILDRHIKSPATIGRNSIALTHPGIVVDKKRTPAKIRFRGEEIPYIRLDEDEIVIDEG